jgi:transposase-like protein
MAIAKEQIRQIISENNICSVSDVYSLLKDSFKDILQELMEAELVSKITYKVLPQGKDWQSRPLNPVYPFVFMDCIHYKVREDGRILSRAAYIVLGMTVEGYKDILSITVGANETSKFWLGMLNDFLLRRWSARFQRDHTGCVSAGADTEAYYTHAPNEAAALSELEAVKEKWGRKCPYALRNWENNWDDVSAFF